MYTLVEKGVVLISLKYLLQLTEEKSQQEMNILKHITGYILACLVVSSSRKPN